MQRRTFIAASSGVGLTAIAGCIGEDDETSPTETSNTTSDNNETDDTTEETPTESPSFGPAIWSQSDGNPKGTASADVTTLTTDEPVTSVLGKEFARLPVLTADRAIWNGAVYDFSGDRVRDLPVSGDELRTDVLPAVGEEIVVIPTATELVGVDPLSGAEQWRYTTRSRVRGLRTHGDAVYAVLPDDESIISVGLSSGDRRWRSTELESPDPRAFVAGEYLYALDDPLAGDSFLVAVDFDTGERVTDVGRFFNAAVVGPSDDLYVPSRRVSPEGDVRWQNDDTDDPVAVDDQYVYDVDLGGFDESTLRAHNLEDGSIQWTFTLPGFSPGQDDIAVGAERVYVTGVSSDRVFAISKADGTRAAIYSVPEPAGVAVTENTLAVVSGFTNEYSDDIYTRAGVRLLQDG